MAAIRPLLAILIPMLLASGCLGPESAPAASPRDPQSGPLETGTAEPAATTTAAHDSAATVSESNPWSQNNRFHVGLMIVAPCSTKCPSKPHFAQNITHTAVGFGPSLDVPEWNASEFFRIEATWNASTPAAEVLDFVWRAEDSGAHVAIATGVSPLVIDVPKNAVTMPGRYWYDFTPSPAGVLIDQTIDITIRLA